MVRACAAALSGGGTITTPSEEVARALQDAGLDARATDLAELDPRSADAVALLDGELARAGEHAEGLLADLAAVLRPGGLLAVAVPGPLVGAGGRRFTAAPRAEAVGHRGLEVELLAAPGAAARARGRSGAPEAGDELLDRSPGLLDAGDALVAVGRAPRDERQRSATFFGSVPRKVVAAAVLCRDPSGRLLVVHDSFRRHWTIPGGVVDADEDPRSAAIREAYEEAGLHVEAERLLGVFSSSFPDRLVFVYEAWPVEPDRGTRPPRRCAPDTDQSTPPPRRFAPDVAAPAPLHTHEVDEAAWVELANGLARVAPYVREQLVRCLESPGGTWRQ